jgi:Fe-S cluster biogenesis protein NfuA
MALSVPDEVDRVFREVLVPLVRTDGGQVHLVSWSPEEVHVHLSGACSGCPGATFTRDRVFEPALLAVAPKTKLKLTTGWRIPEGARALPSPR